MFITHVVDKTIFFLSKRPVKGEREARLSNCNRNVTSVGVGSRIEGHRVIGMR